MNAEQTGGSNTHACRKRPWVLTTLADDEALDVDGRLPQGLEFHLSQCASCRAVADRMQRVTRSLTAVGDLEVPEGLAERAEARAISALRAGAKLTGRVEIPDDLEDADQVGTMLLWPTFVRYASAAVILVALTLYGWSLTNHSSTMRPVVEVDPIPSFTGATDPATAPLHSPFGTSDRPDGSRVASSDPQTPQKPRRIRHFASHLDGALSDEPGGFQSPVVLPDRRVPTVTWSALFDFRSSPVSTGPSADQP